MNGKLLTITEAAAKLRRSIGQPLWLVLIGALKGERRDSRYVASADVDRFARDRKRETGRDDGVKTRAAARVLGPEKN